MPGSSHQLVLAFIAGCSPKPRVLDLGTGKGELAKRVRPYCSFLAGIENDAIAAEQARPFFDHLEVADVRDVDRLFKEPFDLVVLGDILEHLPEPEIVLRKIHRLVKDRGRLLVSVPNVANVTVRLGLLFGRFNYQDKGILDRTHLRFYTRRTARKLLEEAGCVICRSEATPMPLELALPWLRGTPLIPPIRVLTQILAKLFPALFGYQFFFEATIKRKEPTPRENFH
jgi:SAM-dependent methyltransferase